MSERDDFAAFVEDVGARIGTLVRCRKMRRDGYEFDGEWFPPFDEYEARAIDSRRLWTFDAALAEFPREDVRDVIECNLEAP